MSNTLLRALLTTVKSDRLSPNTYCSLRAFLVNTWLRKMQVDPQQVELVSLGSPKSII
ncbi:MAG: hypothetical protein J5601_02840 [Elusimicrobiaceae bacterium]|nr:hypothetical protein [Elusimicrobiaceae bacterium]